MRKRFKSSAIQSRALRVLFLLVFSLSITPSSFARSCAKYLVRDKVVDAPRAAFEPKLDSLPPAIETIISLALENPSFSNRIRRLLGPNPTPRELLIAAIQDDDLRRNISDAALAEVKRAGKSARRDAGTGSTEEVYDVIFWGAGIHEGNMQSALRQLAPELRTLTIEQNDMIASTFAVGGTAFNINSSSRAENPEHLRQALGDGDLNYMPGGVVQVSQFDNDRNPVAQSLAQAATINRSLAPNEVEFKKKIVSIEYDPRTGYKRVRLSDGTVRLARRVVNTGLGTSVRPNIPGLAQIYVRDTETGQMRAFTFFEFLQYVNSARTPMKLFAGKRVGVVGPGDSGKAIIRWLLGKANPKSYGLNGRRVRGPSKVLWYGQTAKTCAEFVEANRSFYFDLAGGYRTEILESRPKIASVTDGSGTDASMGATDVEGGSENLDFIVVTTGFENDIGKALAPLLGIDPTQTKGIEEDPRYFRPVNGFEPTLGDVIYAKEAVGSDGQGLGIYNVGPAAGKVARDDELRAIEENTVAMANHSWRAWRMAEALIQSIRAETGASPTSGAERPSRSSRNREKLALEQSGSEASASELYRLEPTSVLTPKETIIEIGDDLGLIAALADVVQSEFSVPIQPPLLSSVIGLLLSKADDGSIRMQFQPAVRDRQGRALTDAIQRDPVAVKMIQKWLAEGNQSLSVRIGFDGNGKIIPRECRVEKVTKAFQSPMKDQAVYRGGNGFGADKIELLRGKLDTEFKDRYPTQNYRGVDGQERVAKIFADDMAAAYDAAKQIYGDRVERILGWRRMTLQADQSRELRRALDTEFRERFPTENFRGIDGQERVAKIFAGDMAATYDAAKQIYGERVEPTLRWRRMTLQADKSRELRRALDTEFRDRYPTEEFREIDGQERVAKIFADDMAAAYDAAKQIYGDRVEKVLGWRRMTLQADKSRELRRALDTEFRDRYPTEEFREIDEQERVAKIFEGDMAATYDAAKQIYGERVEPTLRWRRITLKADDSRALRKALDTEFRDRYPTEAFREIDGQERVAKIFDGDMAATYDAAKQIYGERVEPTLRWRRITLKADKSRALRASLDSEFKERYATENYRDLSGHTRIASRLFSGDMAQAYDAAVEIYGEVAVKRTLRWTRVE